MIALRVSPRVLALHAGAAILWALLLVFCSRNLYDDPSSSFYDPLSEASLRATRARQAEVDQYLNKVALGVGVDDAESRQRRPQQDLSRWPKRLCLGVVSNPSRRDHGEDSLMCTLSSLRSGLTLDDRESMHVAVLLASESPANHFAFGQPWLSKLADEVLVYRGRGEHSDIPAAIYHEVDWEVNRGSPPRSRTPTEGLRLDYSVLLEACRATQASYVALVEPDFVATGDWYTRLVEALAVANKLERDTGDDWGYIKLFYHLDARYVWRNDDWVVCTLKWVLGYTFGLVAGVGLYRWGYHRKGASMKALWQDSLPLLSLALWIPLFARLFFVAGGVDALRHHFQPYVGGVREMVHGGCCGHGVLLHPRHAGEFLQAFKTPPFDSSAATLLDELTGETGLTKWGMDPSIVL